MERLGHRDPQAFAALFERNQARIVRYVCSLVRDPAMAEDLTQDTFVKAYKALQKGPAPQNLNAWRYHVATNTAMSALRRRRIIAWLPIHLGLAADDPVNNSGQEDRAVEKDLIAQALGRLREADASCLLLRFQERLSREELTEVLGLSVPAARMRLCRARVAFRDIYLRLDEEAKP